MEASRNLLYSPPTISPRTQLKNTIFSSSSSSVSMFHHEQSATASTSIPITSVARHFPTSVLSQEQRDDYRPVSHFLKEDKAYSEETDKPQIGNEAKTQEAKASDNSGQLGFEQQLLQWPDLRLALLKLGEDPSASLNMQFVAADAEEISNVEPSDVVALAKKALSASKQAASLAEELKLDLDDSLSHSLGSANSSTLPIEEEAVTVRSTKRLERQSKRRRVQPEVTICETYGLRKKDVRRKLSENSDPNDHSSYLRMFLWGPETKQLLTAKEESELIIQVQDLKRLMKVKSKLQSQFGREPTFVEWAEVAGLSCLALQAELQSGKRSREKLIHANLRMVVHIAKQYTGRGLSLQDLLQEGSIGLMKSVEKFKPQAGCRFATYAYWWIRQTITKSIMQHSKTIRLPENVYGLLGKVWDAKRSLVQEGNHCPSKEELARRVGITVEKLDKLLFSTRTPLSMQQPIWSDQDTTFQEVTADTGIEIPDVSVAKQLMRQHVRNLLSVLSPKEKKIIRLRFGIEESKQNSLSEIGKMFGLSKERVRQLESRALDKLKQCMVKHGLGSYEDLLV